MRAPQRVDDRRVRAISNWLVFSQLFSVSSLLRWLPFATGGVSPYRSAGLNLGS